MYMNVGTIIISKREDQLTFNKRKCFIELRKTGLHNVIGYNDSTVIRLHCYKKIDEKA